MRQKIPKRITNAVKYHYRQNLSPARWVNSIDFTYLAGDKAVLCQIATVD